MSTFLSADYWNERYMNNAVPWDLGTVSPPLKAYFDQLPNKNISILIPGAGNSYEALYLLEQGFTNITVIDIAPAAIQSLKEKFRNHAAIQFIQTDFFDWEGQYDLIVEQTFFCAIDPILRKKYISKMASLLSSDGKLVGLLFNRQFEGGPPFGGDKDSYQPLFEKHFQIDRMAPCYNSVAPRAGTELFFIARRRK